MKTNAVSVGEYLLSIKSVQLDISGSHWIKKMQLSVFREPSMEGVFKEKLQRVWLDVTYPCQLCILYSSHFDANDQ